MARSVERVRMVSIASRQPAIWRDGRGGATSAGSSMTTPLGAGADGCDTLAPGLTDEGTGMAEGGADAVPEAAVSGAGWALTRDAEPRAARTRTATIDTLW